MAKQTINIGASPNDGTGTPLRTSFDYCNLNFTELYTALGGGVGLPGATTQVIFNDGGTNLAGDAGLVYNKTTDTLTAGNATITGDLTVDTSTLKVDSANDRVGIGTITPGQKLEVFTSTADTRVRINSTSVIATEYFRSGTGIWLVGSDSTNAFKIARGSNFGGAADYLSIASATADCTWFDAAGGTRMTLNSTGLGIGRSPSYRFQASSGTKATTASIATVGGITTTDSDDFGIFFRIKTDATATNRYAAITAFDNGGGNGARDLVLQDLGGNVGIGVTPSAWLSSLSVLQVKGVSGLYGAGSSEFGSVQNCFYNASSQWIYGTTAAAGKYAISAGVHQWFNAPSGTAGNAITFTQAMTLTAAGDLLVGTTTNTNSSRVFIRNGSAAAPSLALQGITGDTNQAGLLVGKFDNDSTSAQILVRFTINNNSGGSGQINANGASQAAFGSYSDSRLKENIVSLPSQLANILSLRPVEFDYKDGSGHQIGFVAQEIQKVYSDTVGEQDGFLTVTGWSKTEARLVSAIKELAAKVQSLEAKLA